MSQRGEVRKQAPLLVEAPGKRRKEPDVDGLVLIGSLRRWAAKVMCAGLLLGLAAPSLASAAPGDSFSCRASAARVDLNGAPVIEPFVANQADKPCAAGSADVVTPTTIGPLGVNAVNVKTSLSPGVSAAASSTVTNPTVTLGALVVHADVLGATAGYTCQNGSPVASNSGQVLGLTINGNAVTVPPGINQTVPLGPLGSLVLNEVDTSQSGTITRRAIDLTTPLGTVVISEATADISGNPCTQTVVTPGKPGGGHRRIRGTARLVVSPRSAARLIASHRCVRSFVATVKGRRIARVVFSLDGHQIAIARNAPFQAMVGAGPGQHHLVARVTFSAASHTKSRTLRLSFIGCATPPRFTG